MNMRQKQTPRMLEISTSGAHKKSHFKMSLVAVHSNHCMSVSVTILAEHVDIALPLVPAILTPGFRTHRLCSPKALRW